MNEEIRKGLEKVRNFVEVDCVDAGRELTDTIVRALDQDCIDEDDLNNMRFSIELTGRGRRQIYGSEVAEELREKMVSALTSHTTDRKKKAEKRVLCARVLVSSLSGSEAEKIAEEIWIRDFYRIYYPAMEAEADNMPTESLMNWYAAFLTKDIMYSKEARMFNRLAYYWLSIQGYSPQTYYAVEMKTDNECIKKAKAYFMAMERRGIPRENPYVTGFGHGNHDEVITRLLNDEYDDVKAKHLAGCISDTISDMADGDIRPISEMALKNNMREMIRSIEERNDSAYLKVWDDVLKEYGDTLKKCCDNSIAEKSRRTAEIMASCLSDRDNWLLRYIEIELGRDSNKKFFAEVETWHNRIKSLSLKDSWVLLNSLQGLLIAEYRENGETDKLVQMLEEITSTTDTMAYISDEFDDLLGVRYCTPNTTALLKLYMETDRRDMAEKIINEISECPIEPANYSFGPYDSLWIAWTKYIMFLKDYGYADESLIWENKLKEFFNMSDSELCCELEYLSGNYEEALRCCEESFKNSAEDEEVRYYKNRREKEDFATLLRYLIDGSIPEDIDKNRVEVLPDKEPESVHCRGYINRLIKQWTNDEWHKHSATSSTMANQFNNGLHNEDHPMIYPANYYTIPLSFEPEPANFRGDYISYLYGNHVTDWFGFTRKDFEKVKKSVETTSM